VYTKDSLQKGLDLLWGQHTIFPKLKKGGIKSCAAERGGTQRTGTPLLKKLHNNFVKHRGTCIGNNAPSLWGKQKKRKKKKALTPGYHGALKSLCGHTTLRGRKRGEEGNRCMRRILGGLNWNRADWLGTFWARSMGKKKSRLQPQEGGTV